MESTAGGAKFRSSSLNSLIAFVTPPRASGRVQVAGAFRQIPFSVGGAGEEQRRLHI
jgi:hypothetical protein